jgi:hypothetical protein
MFYTFCPLIPEDSPCPPVIPRVVKNVHQGLDLVPCSIFRNTLLTFRNKQTLRVSHVYLLNEVSSRVAVDIEISKRVMNEIKT